MKIKQIFSNNQNWIAEKLKTDPAYFKNLSKGQNSEGYHADLQDNLNRLMSVEKHDLFKSKQL